MSTPGLSFLFLSGSSVWFERLFAKHRHALHCLSSKQTAISDTNRDSHFLCVVALQADFCPSTCLTIFSPSLCCCPLPFFVCRPYIFVKLFYSISIMSSYLVQFFVAIEILEVKLLRHKIPAEWRVAFSRSFRAVLVTFTGGCSLSALVLIKPTKKKKSIIDRFQVVGGNSIFYCPPAIACAVMEGDHT